MINTNNLRGVENASAIQNLNKQTPSDQRIFRMKANALSDVQNTLHSRPVHLGNSTNPAIKVPNKPSTQSLGCENVLPRKKILSGRKPKSASINTWKELQSAPHVHSDHLEYHNHILCEKSEHSSMSDFLVSYKLSDSQISTLTKSVKNFIAPVTYVVREPCTDIEIPIVTKSEDPFSVSDVFSDILPIKMEAPGDL